MIMIHSSVYSPGYPVIAPSGDRALTVTLGSEISGPLSDRVQALRADLVTVDGVEACVPAYASLLVLFDPSRISRGKLARRIRESLAKPPDHVHTAPAIFYIPVCYGGSFGEDLPFVARHAGLSEEEVISLHAAPDYYIYMMGFLPGFAYLGGLNKRLNTPRLEVPKANIPSGSVGIGGSQTGLYPLDSPGGWHIIGRTPLKPYDPNRQDPFLYRAGNYLHLVPVSEREYGLIQNDVRAGTYRVEIQPIRMLMGGEPK